jgi:arginine:ornithine antiporter/lysine permease
MQLAMLLVYFSNNAWNTMLSITGVMVLPAYLASTCYLWKICEDGEIDTKLGIGRALALFTSIFGTLYALWLIYAAGLKYLLMAIIFIALGIPVYIWARRENLPSSKIFTRNEKYLMGTILIVCIIAIYVLARGIVQV